MRLYDYWRSTAAYRVRIALNIKDLDYEQVAIDMRAGWQRSEEYLRTNPQGLVPYLEDGATAIGQSMAIMEYLEEVHPNPPLLPTEPALRAKVRQIAQIVVADIHPLNNVRVLAYLERILGCGQQQSGAWYHHWLMLGFDGMERIVADLPGDFCLGDQPTLADVCLVPQIYNAKRFEFDLKNYPTLRAINDRCQELPAFAKAAPQHQPDA